MNARAVADTPPVISSITPRSQVMSETRMEYEKRLDSRETEWWYDRMGTYGAWKRRGWKWWRRRVCACWMVRVRKRIARWPRSQNMNNNSFDEYGRFQSKWMLTSLHTKSSNGRVVNIFNPKQNLATLIKVSFFNRTSIFPRSSHVEKKTWRTAEKLFKIFPCVLSVKTTYAEIANVQQATNEMTVEICVTFANLSKVGVLKLP